MQAFLEVVGLRPRIEAQRGGWVDLTADSGMVALHDAASSVMRAKPGQTCLSFEVNDLDKLAERLRDADVPDVTIHDEAYGRVLSCTDPLGDQIWIDGRTEDLYGYRAHPESRPEAGLSVVPVRFTDPQGAVRRLAGRARPDPGRGVQRVLRHVRRRRRRARLRRAALRLHRHRR